MTEENSIHERLLSLENEVRELKKDKSSESPKEKKEKKEKKPREPTEYNKFVSKYINNQKEILKDDFNHKKAFKEAAEAWNSKKEKK